MILKVFTQPGCPKCPPAKELAKKVSAQVKVETYDTSTVEGMAEGAFYQVLGTPTLILVDEQGKEIAAWRGEVPPEKRLLSKLS